jgi:hypothetical protein
MKQFEAWKVVILGMLVLGVFVLPGCGRGTAGGGNWDRPVTVSSTSPANDEAGVPVGNRLSVTFSGPMDPATITPATFTLRKGQTAVNGAVSYSGVTAVFAPATNLSANTLYTATITTGAKDSAGRNLANDYVWSFTTGATLDAIPPNAISTVPVNLATGVATNSAVTATFDEAMEPSTLNAATFTLNQGSTHIPGSVDYTGVTAVFTPTANLQPGLLYTATISTGAKDLAGNALEADKVWRFTTAAGPDATLPTVLSTVPLNAATAVATNSAVSAVFSEAMNPQTITTATFFLTGGTTPGHINGTVAYSGVTGLLRPAVNLQINTVYTATITGGVNGAKDLKGNALALDKVWTFTTGAGPDTTRPTVISTIPPDLATGVALNTPVSATFSESMDPLTITATSFTLKQGTTTVPGALTYSDVTATYKPTGNLAAGVTYTARVTTGAKDLKGNALAADKVWTFTTAAAAGLSPGAVPLASAGSFGIMATSAITNTGAGTKIIGDVSLDPGTSNGLLPVQVTGAIHINDSVSEQARLDLLAAYNFAKNLPPGTTITGGADLGALAALPPGTYTSGSTMLVSTPLVLNGNANSVWVFQIGSSLTTTANVTLTGGALAKNVFWVPTSDATVGVGSTFFGTIVSGRDVTAKTGAVINGRILAGAILPGTIALDNNTVTVPAP